MLHRGHRQRVRNRILRYGTDSLAGHERLEALLFYAIPYRDTNPTAHRLFNTFGTPDAIFHAGAEKLKVIPGVGSETAAFLSLCGEIADFVRNDSRTRPVYDTKEKIGRLFVRHFRNVKEEKVAVLLLNNRAEMIALSDVYTGSVNSARFRPAEVIRFALMRNASFLVLGHNHLTDVAIPSSDDLDTTRFMEESLSAAGIPLIDHILVAGNRYVSLKSLRTFSHDIKPGLFNASFPSEPVAEADAGSDEREKHERSLMTALLAYAGKPKNDGSTEDVFRCFPTLSDSLRSECHDLLACTGISESAAVLLRLLGSLVFMKQSKIASGKRPVTMEDAARYVREYDGGSRRETVYLLLLDADDCLLDIAKVGEGVANSAVFLSRRLLEVAVFGGADHVILAHTHPDGTTQPSRADIEATVTIRDVFMRAGIPLTEHLVVTDNAYRPILSYLDGDDGNTENS